MRAQAAACLGAGWFIACLAAPADSRPARYSETPGAMIRSLYRLDVSRRPFGIDSPHFLKLFAPYLSERLIQRIKSDRLCENDWWRRTRGLYRGNPWKAPFAWQELGLFSGYDDGEPAAFQIERSEPQEDGSILFYLRFRARELTYSPDLPNGPPEKPYFWEAAVPVVRERGRPVVDDVIYTGLKSDLSHVINANCRGSHWDGRY